MKRYGLLAHCVFALGFGVAAGAQGTDDFDAWAEGHLEKVSYDAFAEVVGHKPELWNGLALLGACGKKEQAQQLIRDLLPYQQDFSRKVAAAASGLTEEKEQQLRVKADNVYGQMVTGYSITAQRLLRTIMADAPDTRDSLCRTADAYYETYLENREHIKMEAFWKKRRREAREAEKPASP